MESLVQSQGSSHLCSGGPAPSQRECSQWSCRCTRHLQDAGARRCTTLAKLPCLQGVFEISAPEKSNGCQKHPLGTYYKRALLQKAPGIGTKEAELGILMPQPRAPPCLSWLSAWKRSPITLFPTTRLLPTKEEKHIYFS